MPQTYIPLKIQNIAYNNRKTLEAFYHIPIFPSRAYESLHSNLTVVVVAVVVLGTVVAVVVVLDLTMMVVVAVAVVDRQGGAGGDEQGFSSYIFGWWSNLGDYRLTRLARLIYCYLVNRANIWLTLLLACCVKY